MGRLGDLFGKAAFAPFGAILRRYPWLKWVLILLPVLLLIGLFEPAFRVLSKALELIFTSFAPMLQNPTGRLVLLNVLLLALLVVGYWLLRRRIRDTFSGMVLRRHIQAVGLLVTNRPEHARELLIKVARARARPPKEYPAAAEDAKLKLARLLLAQGDVDGALSWLARCREKGMPRELRRSLMQLRAECYLAQGEVLPETLERSLREALKLFTDDHHLLGLLRRVVLERGDPFEAAELQERLCKSAPPRQREEERVRLVEDLLIAGEAALQQGETGKARSLAKKARASMPDHPGPDCLLGDIRQAEGDLRGAVREWGRSRSPLGLERIAELLDREPEALSPRELLECSPTEGTLLLVAREYARVGECRRALRAARRAAKSLGRSPSVQAILVEVLSRCGREEEARRLCEEAVLRLAAPDG